MLNIFKKSVESKIKGKISDNIEELYRIAKMPLTGEIIEIDKIKIPNKFVKPRAYKMIDRKGYYKRNGYLKVPIILDYKNRLVDGYTSYLVAKEEGFENVIIVREV